MSKKALITGITGQDGSYLAESLLRKGYEVWGIVRRSSVDNLARLRQLDGFKELRLLYGDLTDAVSIGRPIMTIKPDEIYNLGAMSHVRLSFDAPAACYDVNAIGTLNVLEAVRHLSRKSRVYQASSSEMFGKVLETPQRETTPFNPQSPYGCAKVAAHFQVANYRQSYGLHASCGILFNHESERRGETFVTRKISKAVARIAKGLQNDVTLGNLEARRDWGYAPEYVEMMQLMLQQDEPGDYVVATGQTYSVREFAEAAFKYIGRDYQQYVRYDQALERPAEVDLLLGDASKAEKVLGWKPKVTFKQLVEKMVQYDIENEC